MHEQHGLDRQETGAKTHVLRRGAMSTGWASGPIGVWL
jgi:hypothetical protein